MDDVNKLMNTIGARVGYRQFHEPTPEGHTQVPRRAAPLPETEPAADGGEPLYDPEGAPFESHPLAADAIAPLSPDAGLESDVPSEDRSAAPALGRYAPPEDEAVQPGSRRLIDIFARLEGEDRGPSAPRRP